MKRLVSFFMFSFTLLAFGQKEAKEFNPSGFIDLNAYYDSRDQATYTINMLTNLNHGFQYFAFVNYFNPLKSQNSDMESYYSENNLRWQLPSLNLIKLSYQWVNRSGPKNDLHRLGAIWMTSQTPGSQKLCQKIHLFYFLGFHLVQLSPQKLSALPQIEHVYNLKLLPKWTKNKLYLGGFADQNIHYEENGGISFTFVTEHQLGFEILKGFYVVIELRHNGFLPQQKNGLGYGLEYKINY